MDTRKGGRGRTDKSTSGAGMNGTSRQGLAPNAAHSLLPKLFLPGLRLVKAPFAESMRHPRVVERLLLSDESRPSFLQALRARNLHLASWAIPSPEAAASHGTAGPRTRGSYARHPFVNQPRLGLSTSPNTGSQQNYAWLRLGDSVGGSASDESFVVLRVCRAIASAACCSGVTPVKMRPL